MKNLKAPLIIFVVLGLIYGGAKGFVYFQTQSKLNAMIQQAQLFADIQYDGISSDLLKGEIAVNNLVITPVTLQDSVTISQVAIQGDGPMFLFSDAAKMQNQTPEFMQLSLRNINASLDGQMFASINTLAAQVNQPKSCSLGGAMTPDDLKSMGINELAADLFMTVSRPKLSNKTRIEIDLMLEGLADLSMMASIRGGDNPMAIAMAPQADEIRFNYHVNASYMTKMKRYCAGQLEMSEKQYIESIAAASDKAYLQYYGIVPGDGIRQAIRQFMQNPQSIELVMVPAADLNPALLGQYRPADAIEMLGLQLNVNGKKVENLDFSLGDELNALFGEQSLKKDNEEQAAEAVKPLVSYTYQITPMNRLSQYIGAQLKVELTDGMEREGALLSVNANDLLLEQRMHGGKFQVYVPKDKVRQVRVLRLLRQ